MAGLDLDEAIELQEKYQKGVKSQIDSTQLMGNPGTVQFFSPPAGQAQRLRMIDAALPSGPITGLSFSLSFGMQSVDNPANLDYARAFIQFGAAGGSLLSGQIDLGYGQTISVPGSHIVCDVQIASAVAGQVNVLVGAFATLEAIPRTRMVNDIFRMNNIAVGATVWTGYPGILPFTQCFRVFTSDNQNDHFIIHAGDGPVGADSYTVEQTPGSVPVECPLHSLISQIGIENIGANPIVRASIFYDIEL